MCMLSLIARTLVVELVDKWTKQRKRFTGYDVTQKLGFRDQDSREVGSYLRELFNGRALCFEGYACYPVRGKVEPLLYFPVPAWVKRDGEKMQKE